MTDIWTYYFGGCETGGPPKPFVETPGRLYFQITAQMDGTAFRLPTTQNFQMTDSVQIKLRQRTAIMLMVFELAERDLAPDADG